MAGGHCADGTSLGPIRHPRNHSYKLSPALPGGRASEGSLGASPRWEEPQRGQWSRPPRGATSGAGEGTLETLPQLTLTSLLAQS